MRLQPLPFDYKALNAQKGDDVVIGGPKGVSREIFFEKSNSVKFSTLKIDFILVKISYCRALFAQKCENEAILGGYDVIGNPRGLSRKRFYKGGIKSTFLL